MQEAFRTSFLSPILLKAEEMGGGGGAWSKEMTNEVVASGIRRLATYRGIEQ